MKNPWLQRPRQLTVAELCEALEKGTLPSRMEDGEYVISHRDIARLAEADTDNTANTIKMPAIKRLPARLAIKAG